MMKKIKYILILALLVSTVALSGCGGKSESTAEQSSYTPTPTDTTVKTTGEKILINDSTLGEIWITELANVPKNTLDKNNFSADANFKYYNVNGKAASTEGVDVSDYNGTIDWKKVKDSGIDFAMIRIGGRGYGTEGTLYQDENAIKNITEAKDNGIKVGVYFFSQAINTDEASEEANYVKAILGDIKLDYPVAYDWEIVKDDDARKIITEMLEADLFIFSSPIYYGQMSGQAKTLIDRFYQVSQNPDKTLEGTKVIEIFTQAQPSDAFAAYIDSMKVIPFGYMGMEIVDTIVAKGAAGKGDGLEEAIAQIEKIGDKL